MVFGVTFSAYGSTRFIGQFWKTDFLAIISLQKPRKWPNWGSRTTFFERTVRKNSYFLPSTGRDILPERYNDVSVTGSLRVFLDDGLLLCSSFSRIFGFSLDDFYFFWRVPTVLPSRSNLSLKVHQLFQRFLELSWHGNHNFLRFRERFKDLCRIFGSSIQNVQNHRDTDCWRGWPDQRLQQVWFEHR